MTDREWEKFFDLMSKIVNEEGKTFEQKKRQLLEKAKEHGVELDLEEFGSWCID